MESKIINLGIESDRGNVAPFVGPVVLDLGEVSVDTLGVTGGADEDTGHPYRTI